VHLYVTITDENTEFIEDIKRLSKDVFLVENRGMDIGPFIYAYNKVRHLGYSTYLKLQSKKSMHSPGIGDHWRQSLYYSIVENYNYILENVQNSDIPWMLGEYNWYYDMIREPKTDSNKIAAKPYLDKAITELGISDEGSFFAGTMFLTNSIYLETLFKDIDLMEFYNKFELGYHRDSFAHGMERALGYGIQYHGGTYIVI
jgi:hypothetical protein